MNDREWAALQKTWDNLGYAADGKLPDKFKKEDFQFAIRAIVESWCKKVVGEGAATLRPVWAAYPEREGVWMDKQRKILDQSLEGIEGLETWMNFMWQQAISNPYEGNGKAAGVMMNDKEWAYVGEVARKLGGEGKVPVEMRGRDCREVIKSMIDGYIFTAKVTAEQRAGELPFWKRNAAKKLFMEMAVKRTADLLAEADLWLATERGLSAAQSAIAGPYMGTVSKEPSQGESFQKLAQDIFQLAKSGTPEQVHAAITTGADIDHRDRAGRTLLMYAAGWNSNPEVITLLLKAKPTVDDSAEEGPNPSPMLMGSESGWTALMYAAENNPNPEIIIVLLGAGANLHDRVTHTHHGLAHGRTPLMLAASHNPNPEVIAVLLRAGAKAGERNEIGRTPLMYAAGFNPNPEVITVLLRAAVKLDDQDEDGRTPLMYAAGFNRNPKVIHALLKAGVNVKLKSIEGKTAFDYASENQKVKGTDVFWELNNANP